MGVQPRVDALHVKGVLAFREEPEDLGGFESAEADGALQPVLVSPERPEPENREGLDDGPVDSGVFTESRRSGRSGIGGVVEADDDDTTALAVLGVEEEKKRDGEQCGENSDDDAYAWPERIGHSRIFIKRRWRW